MLFLRLCSTNDNSASLLLSNRCKPLSLAPHYFMQQQKNHIEILPAQINSIMLHVYLSLNYRQIKRYITKIHVPHNYRYPKSTFTFKTGLFTPFLD